MRVALIGFGLAGEAFHAPFIATTDGLTLATIVTGGPARAARAQQAHPGARVTGDADLAWDADLVVVATPNRFHLSFAHEALARGVPAVIDKPLATSLREVDVLLGDLARTNGRLTVFQNRRWDGDFLTARRLLAGGDLGRPIRFHSRFTRFRPEIKPGFRESGDPRDGGGVLLDLGPHLVDQALLLLGPARSVYAEIEALRDGVRADDDAVVVIRHESGARSHLAMSAVAPVPSVRMELSGTAGGFASQDLDVQEAQLRAGLGPASPSFGLNPPGSRWDAGGRGDEPVARGDYGAFYRRVVAWLRDGAAAPVDPSDSRAVFEVLEAARRSAASEAVVPMGSLRMLRGL